MMMMMMMYVCIRGISSSSSSSSHTAGPDSPSLSLSLSLSLSPRHDHCFDKIAFFILSDGSDFRMTNNQSITVHVFASRVLMAFSMSDVGELVH